MQLLFLRHGPAESKNEWTGDDEDRPLTGHGKLLVSDMACSLPRLNTRPNVVVTSPLARAQQTAEIVARCLGDSVKVVTDKRLAPGFGMKQLEKVIRDHDEVECLMLVGHDPDFSEVVRALTGGRLSVRKGGLAHVELPDPKFMKGRLVALLVPAASGTEPAGSPGGD
jgi:phosphohistidine phosphatase